MIIKHLFKNVFYKGESGPEGGFEWSSLANEYSEVPGPLEYQTLVLGKFSIRHMFRFTSGLRLVDQIPPGHSDLSFQFPGSGPVSSTNPTPYEWRPAWWEAIVYSELPHGIQIAMVQVCFSVFLRWKEQHIPSSGKGDLIDSHLISHHDR